MKLFVVKTHGSQSILAISSRSWLSYTYQSRFHLTPLSYEVLEYASGFSSEQCPEGLVAISSNSLRVLALQKLGTNFNQSSIPLQYTPRKFCIHPPSNRFGESDSSNDLQVPQFIECPLNLQYLEIHRHVYL